MNGSPGIPIGDGPFRLQVPPSQAFAHPQWQRARQGVLDALQAGRSALLTGPPGAGKTLLLHDLSQTLRQDGVAARLVDHTDAPRQGPRREILLVDEAGSMRAEELASLCRRDAPCVLAALPSFTERLAELDQSFVRVTLEALAPEDVAQYVASNIAASGQEPDLLEPGAVQALADRSGGLLRLVNALGGAAVFLAALEGAGHVTTRHVEEADSLRRGATAETAASGALPSPQAVPPDTPPDTRPQAPPQGTRGSDVAPACASPATATGSVVSGEEGLANLSGTDAAEPMQVADAPAGEAALPVPALRADATARLGSSPSADAGQPRMARRARRLGSAAAGLTVALLGGLVLLRAASEGQRSRWNSVDPASVMPFETETPSPAAQPVETARSQAPVAPENGVPPSPEVQPPRQERAMPARPPLRTAPDPEATRSGGESWRADKEGTLSFRGTVFNETMRQGGRLVLTLRQRPNEAVSIRFEASNGLIGSGELAGRLTPDGHITVSGTLMMGRNPHDCELTGVMTGTHLTGAATFQRHGSGNRTRSTFSLLRG